VGGCELTEVTLATAEDVIVAEVILRTGATDVQYAYLHRTTRTNVTGRVDSARVTVVDEATGGALEYEIAAHPSQCVRPRGNEPTTHELGTCYVARNAGGFVRPEERYSLRIGVADRVLTGRLQVPGAFQLLRPPTRACNLNARQLLELSWSRAANAWVYVTDGHFSNLRQALRREGVQVTGNDPVDLTGLSISGTDTTLVFPREIGLFDRFNEDLHPIVLAIQNGLPADVVVDLTIGAGDRNYVNWVRGGVFNPSGQVRVPSIQGDGTGVFGAIVPVTQQIRVVNTAGPPSCG
jgi:hypothetical protein